MAFKNISKSMSPILFSENSLKSILSHFLEDSWNRTVHSTTTTSLSSSRTYSTESVMFQTHLKAQLQTFNINSLKFFSNCLVTNKRKIHDDVTSSNSPTIYSKNAENEKISNIYSMKAIKVPMSEINKKTSDNNQKYYLMNQAKNFSEIRNHGNKLHKRAIGEEVREKIHALQNKQVGNKLLEFSPLSKEYPEFLLNDGLQKSLNSVKSKQLNLQFDYRTNTYALKYHKKYSNENKSSKKISRTKSSSGGNRNFEGSIKNEESIIKNIINDNNKTFYNNLNKSISLNNIFYSNLGTSWRNDFEKTNESNVQRLNNKNNYRLSRDLITMYTSLTDLHTKRKHTYNMKYNSDRYGDNNEFKEKETQVKSYPFSFGFRIKKKFWTIL